MADRRLMGESMNANFSHLSTARVKKLKYILLAGGKAEADLTAYHNSAYQLWKRSWQKTFSDLKTEAKLKADDFLRQDVIGALFNGTEAVGLLLHTYLNLNLDAVRDHSYLASYPAGILSGLRAGEGADVISMEYLTLDKEWRKSVVGVPLAEVILGLGAKVVEASGFSAAIAVTRIDRRVNEILYGYGARCLVADQKMHNVAVDLISFAKGTIYGGPNPEVNRWVDHFWEQRRDCVGLDHLAPPSGLPKKAA